MVKYEFYHTGVGWGALVAFHNITLSGDYWEGGELRSSNFPSEMLFIRIHSESNRNCTVKMGREYINSVPHTQRDTFPKALGLNG